MNHLLIIIGTRPELIKTAPIIHELIRLGLRNRFTILNTAQHKDLLDPYWQAFNITPDHSLDVMETGQSLSSLTSKIISQIQVYLDKEGQHIDAILAQGDTTTVLGAAMVSFYNKIKFIHLEAGLRSKDLNNPFPEEYNRKVAAITTSIHLTPTQQSANNLIQEGVHVDKIKIIGNTVVDALSYMTKLNEFRAPFHYAPLNTLQKLDGNIILVTCHRRENHGKNLIQIIEALKILAQDYEDFYFIWPVHPNPNVLTHVTSSGLSNLSNFLITPPLDYMDLLKVLYRSRIAISDSGGIQEEAPSFNVPVIVLRETTERPEGVLAGMATLTGSDPVKIKSSFQYYLENPLQNFNNPYGDGSASIKAAKIIFG